jgi:hypothetical protein
VTLYVDAGYFLEDYIEESVAPVPRVRGDDGGVLRRFWRGKADAWIERNLGNLNRAEKPKAKRRVIEVIIETAENMETAPLPVLVMDEIKARMERPVPDYAAIAALLIEGMERQKRIMRRRRDIEALLMLES